MPSLRASRRPIAPAMPRPDDMVAGPRGSLP